MLLEFKVRVILRLTVLGFRVNVLFRTSCQAPSQMGLSTKSELARTLAPAEAGL